ncbi:HxlR family transcriptional regulator [Chitinophaga skermanii]|uniref:HxlR family transcriptional regulator n=1 Tax=Chitinophaga skermanii TaxID=331697 RepID=A0A327QZ23_9BACT|nr:helix-turn-helix domain-containing protein [Chitinophaga skermanii]RAJ08892.1 HxlR family transcriptional regulator [Chitinophaga skermanii]
MERLALEEVKCAAQLLAVEDALYVIGGKWKLRIVIAIMTGYNRFNELQRAIKGISARVLSAELKSLELNGLVKREVKADSTPVIVEYLPTEYARTLRPMITVLSEWGLIHKGRITGKVKSGS